MRYRTVGAFVVVMALWAFPSFVAAQARPDISGIWRMLDPGQTRARAATVGAGASHPTFTNERPPLTPWGQMQWSQTRASGRKSKLAYAYFPNQKDWNDPLFVCDPAGYPRVGGGNTLFRFVQLSNEVAEFFERDRVWRDLWTDGRKLPGNNAKPRWYGYSVAHWEGDTFVVESSGFDDRTWLDWFGSVHSGQMQLVERYKVLDKDHLEFEMILTDPKTYTAPWPGRKQLMERLENSDGVASDIWGNKPDGTPYGDIREDYCVFSEEHAFWVNDDPAGLGDNFGNAITGGGRK